MPSYTLKQLQNEIEKVYLIKDPYITEIMAASVVAHFLPSDPCWMVIIAPPGGMKSEMVNILSLIKWTPPAKQGEQPAEQCVYPLSTLTSKTFVSGQKAISKETSLLLKISNGIIAFKDLTSLLSEQREERTIIMGQLREIYDGKYIKSFGTGETINWNGKITIIAGATYAIHAMKQAYSALGERFIFYNLVQPERVEAAERTMTNQEEGKMAEHRLRLSENMKNYTLDVLDNMPAEIKKIDPLLKKEAIHLAELATRARSGVQRNWYSREQEITDVDPPEMPTRFAGALQAMIRAFMVMNHHETGKMELEDRHRLILSKLALDSITRTRRIAMIELSKYDVLETAGLAVKIGMPANSVRHWLEDLAALEITDREKGQGNRGDRWRIRPHYRDIIRKYEGVKKEGEELILDNAEQSDEELRKEAEEALKSDEPVAEEIVPESLFEDKK